MTWTKEMPANPVVAVAGATGAVGQEFLRVLHDVDFPASEVRALASARSAGKKVPFEGCGLVPAGELTVQEMTPESFEGVDIALFSAGASVSKEMREAVTAAGAVMIDNSSAFRMDEDVPLVVPEVNPQDVAWHSGVIANPNCSTIQMVVALKPLYDLSPIKRVVVSTYQAASGAGAPAMAELYDQTRAFLDGTPEDLSLIHISEPTILREQGVPDAWSACWHRRHLRRTFAQGSDRAPRHRLLGCGRPDPQGSGPERRANRPTPPAVEQASS